MPAPELVIANRAAYLRKAILTPDFSSERVLARDAFQFAELWLKRHCPSALPFWDQARSYYLASKHLPAQSSPLTSYYCFLNATKTLLTVKGVDFSDYHGVSGTFDPTSKRGCGFRSLTEAIDTTTAGGRLIFHIFGALAEFERSIIRERTMAGLDAARARGRKGGRPRLMNDDSLIVAQALLRDGVLTVKDIAKQIGVSEPTLYKYLPSPRSSNARGDKAA